jgi:hypothetical protein
MDQQQTAELYRMYQANFYYIIGAGIVLGLLLGLAPLIMGRKRGKGNVGLITFIISGAIGAFSPLLSLLIAIAVTIYIVRSGNSAAAVNPESTIDGN